jgi:lipid-A-disaccharide synthase-like uncharacterized protein
MGAVMWRIAKAFFVHLPILLLTLGCIYFATSGQDSLSIAVRERYRGASSQALLTVLGDARGDLLTWCAAAFAVSWLASSLFLVAAQRTYPANEAEAGSRIGLWSLLLVVTIGFAVGNGWLALVRARLDLLTQSFFLAAILGGLGLLLAYYLSTGLMVKRVMRPSVPLAAALPSQWS